MALDPTRQITVDKVLGRNLGAMYCPSFLRGVGTK